MTTHAMEIRPKASSIWRGDSFSYIYFTVTYLSHEIRELFHDSSVIKLAAFLYLRYKASDGKKSSQEERKIVCSRLKMDDLLALDFNGKEPSPNQPFPYHLAVKLSTLFSCAQAHTPCLVVRAHREIFDGDCIIDAFRLQLALEVKRHFPTNYSIFNHCNNFFSPIVAKNDSKSDAECVEDEIKSLSCEELVCRWWSQVGDDELILAIEALSEKDHPSIIMGVSEYVDIFEYKIFIEDQYTGNKHVRRVQGSTDVEWDASSPKSKLEVLVYLKDGKGDICHNYPHSVIATAELLYDDGTEAPKYPIGSKKKANGASKEPRSLLNALTSFPKFQPGIGSQTFSFRIEQTSSRHKNHRGFRLKVCVKDGCTDILPCVTEDIIIVIRKRSCGKAVAFDESNTLDYSKLPNVLRMDTSYHKLPFDSPLPSLRIPHKKIKDLFTGGDRNTCLTCNSDLSFCDGTNLSDHLPNCRLAMILSPYIVPSIDGYDQLLTEGATASDLLVALENICVPCESSRSTEPCDDFMEKVDRVLNHDNFELTEFHGTEATLEPDDLSLETALGNSRE